MHAYHIIVRFIDRNNVVVVVQHLGWCFYEVEAFKTYVYHHIIKNNTSSSRYSIEFVLNQKYYDFLFMNYLISNRPTFRTYILFYQQVVYY